MDPLFLDAYINLGNVLKEARIFERWVCSQVAKPAAKIGLPCLLGACGMVVWVERDTPKELTHVVG